jgi:hypothetical protein
MRLEFVGAVTGSKYLLEYGGKRMPRTNYLQLQRFF